MATRSRDMITAIPSNLAIFIDFILTSLVLIYSDGLKAVRRPIQ